MILRPMLAPNESYEIQHAYYPIPCLASFKFDGLRCYKSFGVVRTRSGKPQPNPYVRELLAQLPDGVDGELTVGNFRQSSSALRRTYGKPDFTFNIFDWVYKDPKEDFISRSMRVEAYEWPQWVSIVRQHLITSEDSLFTYETTALEAGYEGLMIRDPSGPYKFNRCTLREGYMLKMKRFTDSEARIIGFYEQMENLNEAVIDELGFTHRSTQQSSKVGKSTLGGLIVQDLVSNKKFRIGTGVGWTKSFRDDAWNNQSKYLGQTIVYKYLHHGDYDLPRNATMKGFRDSWDI